jgi:hypothetical protein
MLSYSKLIPALALAVALVPAAASARSGNLTETNSAAPQQYLVNAQNNASPLQYYGGRADEFNVPVGQKVTQSPTDYATNNPIQNFDNFSG